jgi:radical SAM protein with 4Fe4S-binding SPASM domain
MNPVNTIPMTAKLTLTTACGAACATCPGWKRAPVHGDFLTLAEVWGLLVADGHLEKIIVNNTGDIYSHPDHVRLLKLMERSKGSKFVAMTTNGALLDYVPAFDQLILSWNGATPETYRATTGLSWHAVKARIDAALPEIARLYPGGRCELHCLLWDATDGNHAEETLLEAWKDWPGRIRVSRKYDNQGEEDHTVGRYQRSERIPCDYLDQLCIEPDGSVSMCAHDWTHTERWGNILSDVVKELMRDDRRAKKLVEHLSGIWTGICSTCNYNVPVTDQVRYLR